MDNRQEQQSHRAIIQNYFQNDSLEGDNFICGLISVVSVQDKKRGEGEREEWQVAGGSEDVCNGLQVLLGCAS
jgi:hypothetical protein